MAFVMKSERIMADIQGSDWGVKVGIVMGPSFTSSADSLIVARERTVELARSPIAKMPTRSSNDTDALAIKKHENKNRSFLVMKFRDRLIMLVTP
jgi:hypothetical protein